MDRLDLDTEKPSDEELAKKFGYEEDYYKGNATSNINFHPASATGFIKENFPSWGLNNPNLFARFKL